MFHNHFDGNVCIVPACTALQHVGEQNHEAAIFFQSAPPHVNFLIVVEMNFLVVVDNDDISFLIIEISDHIAVLIANFKILTIPKDYGIGHKSSKAIRIDQSLCSLK